MSIRYMLHVGFRREPQVPSAPQKPDASSDREDDITAGRESKCDDFRDASSRVHLRLCDIIVE